MDIGLGGHPPPSGRLIFYTEAAQENADRQLHGGQRDCAGCVAGKPALPPIELTKLSVRRDAGVRSAFGPGGKGGAVNDLGYGREERGCCTG